jgi:hypothetical protein
VEVFDALLLGVVAGLFGDRERWVGVSVSGDFEMEVGLAVEPGAGHTGGLGDGGHGEREPCFVEASDSGHGSLSGVC